MLFNLLIFAPNGDNISLSTWLRSRKYTLIEVTNKRRANTSQTSLKDERGGNIPKEERIVPQQTCEALYTMLDLFYVRLQIVYA